MSTDHNKAMSRRALQLWGDGRAEDPGEILAEGYLNHQEPDAAGGVSTKDRDAYLELLAGYHAAFSGSTVRILMQIAEDDLVASRWELSATHTGDYLGLAPTNRVATWTGVQIDRHEGGKLVESWVDWDKYRLFATLGLIEQP